MDNNIETLDYQVFLDGLAEIEGFYNKSLSDFAKNAWYKYLKNRLSDKRFMVAVSSALCECQFMPTAQSLAELAGANTSPPGENPIAMPVNYLALPSTEMVVEAMTLEERNAVLQALRLEVESRRNKRKFRDKGSSNGFASIGQVLDPSLNRKAMLDDMKKYLNSGVDELRQRAINWALDPDNGCELVKVDGRVMDIKEIDF